MSWSFEDFLDDLKTDFVDLFWYCVGALADFANSILQAIPVPDFLDGLGPLMAQIPASSLYWLEPVHLGFGLGLISSAVTAAALLRLIPYVGGAFK